MTSFGWKCKAGDKVVKSAVKSFEQDADDSEDEAIASGKVDWLCFAASGSAKQALVLEDTLTKSRRLKEEGEKLAEAERYWEAIRKWDAALQLTPDSYAIMEMKAQAYLALNELYPALQAAEKTTEMNPLWWIGHQTLGRARLGLGEVRMAIKSFTRAIHLNPANEELWQDDLMWAVDLLKKKTLMEDQMRSALDEQSGCKITEVGDNQALSEVEKIQTGLKRGVSESCTDVVKRKCPVNLPVPSDSQKAVVSASRGKINTLKELPDNYVCMRD